jgi:hypothetical protein
VVPCGLTRDARWKATSITSCESDRAPPDGGEVLRARGERGGIGLCGGIVGAEMKRSRHRGAGPVDRAKVPPA